jgi:hypothetical protein
MLALRRQLLQHRIARLPILIRQKYIVMAKPTGVLATLKHQRHLMEQRQQHQKLQMKSQLRAGQKRK